MITGRSTCCLLQAKRSLTLRTSDPWKSLEGTLNAAGVCRAQPQRDQFSAGPLVLLRTGPDQLLALVRTRLGPVPKGWCHLRLNLPGKGPESLGASVVCGEHVSGLSAGFLHVPPEVSGDPCCAVHSDPGHTEPAFRPCCLCRLGTAWSGPSGEHRGWRRCQLAPWWPQQLWLQLLPMARNKQNGM